MLAGETVECLPGLERKGLRTTFGGEWSVRGLQRVLIALVGCTRDGHLEVMGHWAKPSLGSAEWRVDITEVEQATRDACYLQGRRDRRRPGPLVPDLADSRG